MLEICELCKVLSNPLRLELLNHIYQTKDGCNFGYLVDKMQESKFYEPGLCASGVSQYLRELVRINIVRRHRDGCYTNYHADLSHAPKSVANITTLIIKRMQKDTNRDFTRVFPALMNPFRATVVRMLAKSGPLSSEIICDKTKHQSGHLHRDLKSALNAGLIAETHLTQVNIIYHYIRSIDPIVVCIINHLLDSNNHLSTPAP